MRTRNNRSRSRRRVFHRLFLAPLCISGFLLAGCSGGPSESDIDKALRTLYSQSPIPVEIRSVKKLGCQAAEVAGRFMCNVEIEMKAPFVGVQKKAGSIPFIKGSDGWMVEQ